MELNVKFLEELRDRSGLSQSELGDKIGVTRQTIAAWEKGEREPSLGQLSRIATELRISLETLFTASDQGKPGLLFRADDPDTLNKSTQAHLTHRAEEYASVEELVGERPSLPTFIHLETYDTETIENVARDIRRWLGVSEFGPLSEPLTSLESKGIKIIKSCLPNEVSGFSAYTEEIGGVIFINETHPTERQYFTAFHELAHLIFHRKDYKLASGHANSRDPREKTANHFAGAVLLPIDSVRVDLRAYRQRWIPEPILADIKLRYKVSMRTVLRRAWEAGVISKQQHGQGISAINTKYGKDAEGVLLPEPQTLSRLERLTFQALLDEVITTSRAAEILLKKVPEIRQKLEAWQEEVSL